MYHCTFIFPNLIYCKHMRSLNTVNCSILQNLYLPKVIRDRNKQHAYKTSIVYPCFIIFYSIVPESPRWLLSNGKREEAEQIIKKLAKRNGKIVTDEMLSSLEADKHRSKGRLWQLFSTKTLAFRTIVIFINW